MAEPFSRTKGGGGHGSPVAPVVVVALAFAAAGGLFYAYAEQGLKGLVLVGSIALAIALSFVVGLSQLVAALAVLLLLPLDTQVVGSINAIVVVLVTAVYLVRSSISLAGLVASNPLWRPILLFWVTQVVALLLDPALPLFPDIAVRQLLAVTTKFLAFFVYFREVGRASNPRRFQYALLAVVGVQVIVTFLQLRLPEGTVLSPTLGIGGTRVIEYGRSPLGTFSETELLSEFFAMSIFMLAGLIVAASSRGIRMTALLLVPACMFELLTLGARGGIVALLVAFLIVMVLSRYGNAVTAARTLALVVAVLLLLVLALSVQRYVLPQYNYLLDEKLAGTTFVGAAPDSRSGLWEYYVGQIIEKPLIGHGGTSIVHRFRGAGHHSGYFWPHSLYLAVLYTSGLMGLLPLAYLLYRLLGVAVARFRDRSLSSNHRLAHVFMVGAAVVFVLDEYKIEYVRMVNYQLTVWFFFALVCAIRFGDNREGVVATKTSSGGKW